jgi:hypothetical protein
MIRLFSFLSSSSRTKLQLFEVDENGDNGDDDFPHRYLPKLKVKIKKKMLGPKQKYL